MINTTTPGTSLATGTISGVVAQSRTAATGTLFQVVMPAPGGGFTNAGSGYPPSGGSPMPQLVVDTTTASKWWVYKLNSGSVNFTTSPVVTFTAPAAIGTLYSSALPVNGDTVTIYNPISVGLVRVKPTMVAWDAAQQAGVWIQGVRVPGTSAGTVTLNVADTLVVGDNVNILDSEIDRTVLKVPTSTHVANTWQNNFAFSFVGSSPEGAAEQTAKTVAVAGAFFEGNYWSGPKGSLVLDGDVIMRDSRLSGVDVSCPFLDSAAIWKLTAGGVVDEVLGTAAGFCTLAAQAGPWAATATPYSIDVSGGSRYACTFSSISSRCLKNVTLTIGGKATACNGDNVNITNGCNIALGTVTNFDGAFSATTFGGNASIPGVGSIGYFDSTP